MSSSAKFIDPQIASAATFHHDSSIGYPHRRRAYGSPDRDTDLMEMRSSLNLEGKPFIDANIGRRFSNPERQSPKPAAGPEYSYSDYHCDPRKLEEFDYDQIVSYLDRPPTASWLKEAAARCANATYKTKNHLFWSENVGTVKARTFDEFDFKPICGDTRHVLLTYIDA
jgi:hypothetical protein